MKVINGNNQSENGCKKLALSLRNGKGGPEQKTRVYLVAVDEETEKEVCMLMAIYPAKGISRTYPETKLKLQEKGYDTSFTQWHNNGAMFIGPNGLYGMYDKRS